MRTIITAWIVLVAASTATTGFAAAHLHGRLVAFALLVLALLKSRVILSDYLGFSQVPPIRRGFMAILVLWAAIAFVLAAV